jgi:site-specific DNA-methyltransferase (adenine-specific)
MRNIELIHGDCLEKMKDILDGSIDMILCDLPYGITACKWDTVIPFEPLWSLYKRIIKDNGAIVLTASQPFTSALVMSNPKWFKYEWIWIKNNATGHLNAKRKPMSIFEDIVVFGDGALNYFPQGLVPFNKKVRRGHNGDNYGKSGTENFQKFTNYPLDILCFGSDPSKLHPTQKPVALMEYLIKTYTNKGDTVLDNCMGSGTTGVACKNLNRNFIGIELDPDYFKIAEKRINENL